jgi:trehalose-6-phosphate synthase
LMDRAERRTRMQKLRAQVIEHDVHRWANEFLASLDATCDLSVVGGASLPRARGIEDVVRPT